MVDTHAQAVDISWMDVAGWPGPLLGAVEWLTFNKTYNADASIHNMSWLQPAPASFQRATKPTTTASEARNVSLFMEASIHILLCN